MEWKCDESISSLTISYFIIILVCEIFLSKKKKNTLLKNYLSNTFRDVLLRRGNI